MLNFSIDSLSVWEKLRKTREPIIMYGTGNGADKVLDVFEKLNIKISGVTASSGFVRERSFRSFPVKPIEYFEEKYDSFTVIITFGSSIAEVIENIRNISLKHKVLVPVVPVIGTEIFDDNFLEKHTDEINAAYSLMADNISRKVYEGYINFLYGGEISVLFDITTSEEEAYNDILKLDTGETFVDIGAYRGDTIEKFLKYSRGEYKKIIAAEPDIKTFKKLEANCKELLRFEAVNVAVTGIDGEIGFFQNAGRQSSVGGENFIRSVSLPTLCGNAEPSFIKIDSEGCEYDILKGGEKVLKAFKPKMNIAAYHKSEDVFKLPLLINKINPEYKIYLRHHPYIPAWDTLIYCV